MDKREHDNLWIRNNARMLSRLRYERRQHAMWIANHQQSIRSHRLDMLRCADDNPMREMLAGRIRNLNNWIAEYERANMRASHAIAILSHSLSDPR